jgi:hypothetical protein
MCVRVMPDVDLAPEFVAAIKTDVPANPRKKLRGTDAKIEDGSAIIRDMHDHRGKDLRGQRDPGR